MCEAVRAADSVLIAVSGKDGVNVGTEKAVAAADSRGLAKIFFVNGLCDESARFYRVFEDLKASFGPSVCPVVVPYIEDGKANIYINILEYKAYDYSTENPSKWQCLPWVTVWRACARRSMKQWRRPATRCLKSTSPVSRLRRKRSSLVSARCQIRRHLLRCSAATRS